MTQNKVQDAKSPETISKSADSLSLKQSKDINNGERNFDLVIDGVPYFIRSVPFRFNDELRFRIIVNNATEHVFTWDSQLSMLRAIDDDAAILSDRVEEAISQKLQTQVK